MIDLSQIEVMSEDELNEIGLSYEDVEEIANILMNEDY